MIAYAVRIKKENMWAIASEHPNFNPDEFEAWLVEHDGGYFLRDPSSIFDCRYFDELIFEEMYKFVSPGSGELFQRVHKK